MDVVKSVALKRKPKEKTASNSRPRSFRSARGSSEQLLAASRGPAKRLASVLGRAKGLKTTAGVQCRRSFSSPSVMAAARLKAPMALKGPKAKAKVAPRETGAVVAPLRLTQAKFFAKRGSAEGENEAGRGLPEQ